MYCFNTFRAISLLRRENEENEKLLLNKYELEQQVASKDAEINSLKAHVLEVS